MNSKFHIENYSSFFELRSKYPEKIKLISEIMKYAFEHGDYIDSTIYLNGSFKEEDIQFVFKELSFEVNKTITIDNLRSRSYTIVEIRVA